ncbi:polysaccharide biosynthesis protein [Aurantiacibacter spongiae]|uniref:Polysaccharide biosynthesis protein n=1 Tax=Aurantiacibacter spongiae TaxID=2488860 RepID=A0A3N5DPV7_9SPHN|nr:nucleoside-diphosphate sugar epimerase/dehydratase [Aurantiacibacter spongiae]RPF71171.1 polysaccharide biosynthesis protein [Aurantiacibacter spongiae]
MSEQAATAGSAPPRRDAVESRSFTERLGEQLAQKTRVLAVRHRTAFAIVRLIVVLSLDAAAILLALRLSRAILPGVRTLSSLPDWLFISGLTAALIVSMLVFGVYRRSWRFISVLDTAYIAAVLLGSSTLIWLATAAFIFPQRVYGPELALFVAVHVALTLVAMIAVRAVRRGLREQLAMHRRRAALAPRRRVILLGEIDWARIMIDLVRTDPDSGLEIVGVLTPGGQDENLRIGGVRIEGAPEDIHQVVESLDRRGRRPAHLVVQESASLITPQDIVAVASVAEELELSVSRFQPPWARSQRGSDAVDIERMPLADLLGRPEVHIEHSYVEQMVAGRRIMVTGAGGTIGGELVRQIARYDPAEIVLLDHAEYSLYAAEMRTREEFPDLVIHPELCSIRQRTALWQVFERRRPDIVFHAAALKHVPMVETNPAAGIHTNVLGTRNVADAACAFDVTAMVQVSTDKAVNPVGLMGATKRLGELYCQALDLIGSCDEDSPRFLTVRFGNVLGSSGSLIPLFQRQLAAGQPLTVTHPDIERFFMTVQEAVLLILQSSARALQTESDRGTIFVLDMGEPVRIVDIAKRLIRMHGLRPDVDVPINFIGLRPGEKMFEELFDESESKIESAIPGIFEAMPSPVALEHLVEGFRELEKLLESGDADELCALTHKMVKASALSRWSQMLAQITAQVRADAWQPEALAAEESLIERVMNPRADGRASAFPQLDGAGA